MLSHIPCRSCTQGSGTRTTASTWFQCRIYFTFYMILRHHHAQWSSVGDVLYLQNIQYSDSRQSPAAQTFFWDEAAAQDFYLRWFTLWQIVEQMKTTLWKYLSRFLSILVKFASSRDQMLMVARCIFLESLLVRMIFRLSVFVLYVLRIIQMYVKYVLIYCYNYLTNILCCAS